MRGARSQFGVPMTPAARAAHRAVPQRPLARARVPYTRMDPPFAMLNRSQWEMDMDVAQGARPLSLRPSSLPPRERARELEAHPPRDLGFLGLPSEGIDWRGVDPLGRLGDAASAPTGDYVATYGPAVAAILNELLLADPRKDWRVYEAKLVNLKRMSANLPPLVRPLLERRIRVLDAKLQAAKEAAKVQREGEQATRVWRFLGFGATATGVLVGFGLLALSLSGARALHRRSR